MTAYKPLNDDQIKILTDQACSALHWPDITVADGFNPLRVRNTHFIGKVTIGRLAGNVKDCHNLEKTSGIYNAVIADSSIGNDCRIANVGVHIAHYDIADLVCIENVGCLQTAPAATFGNGVVVEVLNEGGGREVILFNDLSVQFAYLTCLHRYRPRVVDKLNAIAKAYVEKIRRDRGKIATAASICSVKQICDVNIGPAAVINGAASLTNGTILSSPDAPSLVGPDAIAHDFIIAEGSQLTDGAIIRKTFVGQGCHVGKQFSSENSLFFANCEAFHGEACCVFAGPYTVTHHKSTLLIAGLFSFYNAGSGTNQSNHMYKLGPVHEGKLARGTKTGSFSYMMWPCRVGPFSVVLGKHTGTFDTADYPFSHIEARADGKAAIIPGLNITTVGTVRDGAKWPSRDRRPDHLKRDIISFDVFSPYTVGKMIKAAASLKKLQDQTDKSIEEVSLGGALVRRPILRTGQKYYRTGIEMYLLEKAFERAEKVVEGGIAKIKAAYQPSADAVYSEDWVDIGGQLMPRKRLRELHDTIESSRVCDLESFTAALEKIHQARPADEWLWVCTALREVLGLDLTNPSDQDLLKIADDYLKVKGKFLRLILADAEKEFDELSRSGFGQDGTAADKENDFIQVRGSYETNKFVQQLQNNLAELERRVTQFKNKLAGR